jgi:hypothetical protein
MTNTSREFTPHEVIRKWDAKNFPRFRSRAKARKARGFGWRP